MPLPLDFADALPTKHDLWLVLWNFWWFDKALFELHVSPFWTDHVFYPQGVSLFFHASAPLTSFLGACLQKAANPFVAYNLLFASTFFLSGYFVFLTVRRFTGNFLASFTAGYIYAFSPYHFARVDQLDHASVQWPALLVYFLFRMKERGERKFAVLSGIAFAVVFYSNVYYGLFSSLLLAAFFIHDLVISRESTAAIRRWFFAAVPAFLLTVPFVAMMFLEPSGGGRFSAPFLVKVHQSLDLAALFTPSYMNPFFADSPIIKKIYATFTAAEDIGYVGLSVVALAALGVFSGRAHARFIAVMAAGFIVLAFGPVLHFFGIVTIAGTPIPMPQYLLQIIPVIGEARVPARYLGMAMLFLGIAAGFGMASLLAARRRFSLVIAAAFLLLLVLEYRQKPFEPYSPPHPAWCDIVKSDPEDCVVMNLPMRISRDPNEWWRSFDPASGDGWFQVLHGKRTVSGPISHTAISRRNVEYLAAAPGIRALVADGPESALAETAPRGTLPEIKYFVLDSRVYSRMSSGERERDIALVERIFAGKIIHEEPDFTLMIAEKR